jgi:hypothetical protein
VEVVVAGHADATGSPRVNDPLSKRRAKAVQKELRRHGGPRLPAFWFGEDQPVSTNDTVESRSRNRRVDIQFVPLETSEPDPIPEPPPTFEEPPPGIEPPPGVKPPPGIEPPPGIVDGPPEVPDGDWDFICTSLGGALVCLTVLCLALRLTVDKCRVPDLPPVLPPPHRKTRPDLRACPVPGTARLPSGRLRARKLMDNLGQPFDMHIEFQNTNDGCDCNCGEYRQYVRGYFKRNGKKELHSLGDGKSLSSTTFQEDVILGIDHPYGHRYKIRLWDSAMGRYHGTTYGSLGDAFTSDNKAKIDRDSGCY